MQTKRNVKKALSIYFIILLLIPLCGLYCKFNLIDLCYLLGVMLCFLNVLLIIKNEEK